MVTTAAAVANLARVRQQIATAAANAGRDAAEVRLVAVTKFVSLEVIRGVLAEGVLDLGENRVQELVSKDKALRKEFPELRWHMLGNLQANKLNALLPRAWLVQSVGSAAMAAAIAARKPLGAEAVQVLLEVNVAGEATKGGVPPEGVRGLAEAVAGWPELRVRGLMAMAPRGADPEGSRPFFRRLRRLRDELAAANIANTQWDELSMGMSQDYMVAVEEGATIVRVGTAIFGARDAEIQGGVVHE